MIKAIKNTILAGLVFLGGVVTGSALNAQPTLQVPTYEVPQVVAYQEASNGNIQLTFEDGTGYFFNKSEVVASQSSKDGEYQVTLVTGDDFSFKFDAEVVEANRVEAKKVEVEAILTETTGNFHISEGEIGVTFTDGSWISADTINNIYTFQPIDLGDWSLDFDNLQDLENCVKTYLELVNQ